MTSNADAEWIENAPSRGLRLPDLRELWRYRELAGFLAQRDLKVRYKQAAFGAAWAVFQPFILMLVFTVVFTRFARVATAKPYPVFTLSGLIVWMYISGSVMRATQVLVGNSALVTKVYFPRLLVPVAAVIPGLLDLLLSLLFLGPVMLFYGVRPTWAIATLPFWVLAMVATVLGVGLLLGTLNVRYRDVNHGITLLLQLWIFVSPVGYPSSLVPDTWRELYFLNPVAGVMEGFRWALTGADWPGSAVFIALSTAAFLLVAGILYFQHSERRFADVI
jgi:ABC-type polysaccharide/polyol phosphate export permease